jgi:hypothetical protein
MPASKVVILLMALLACFVGGLAQGTMCDPEGKTMTCTHVFSGVMVVLTLYTLYLLMTAKCPVLPAGN